MEDGRNVKIFTLGYSQNAKNIQAITFERVFKWGLLKASVRVCLHAEVKKNNILLGISLNFLYISLVS